MYQKHGKETDLLKSEISEEARNLPSLGEPVSGAGW